MLQSMGLQRVRHDSATEQQPGRGHRQACVEAPGRMGWVCGVSSWQGWGTGAAQRLSEASAQFGLEVGAPGWGHALSSCWRGGIFHRAPHSGLLPPRGGRCGVHSAAPSQTGSLTCSPPHFRLPVPSSPGLPSVGYAFLPSWSGSCPGRGKGLAASVCHHRGAGGQGEGAGGTRARMEDPLKGELDRAVRLKLDSKIRGGKGSLLGEAAGEAAWSPGGTQSCGSWAGQRWQGGGTHSCGSWAGQRWRGWGAQSCGSGAGRRGAGVHSPAGAGLGDGPTLASGFLSPQPPRKQQPGLWHFSCH